ALPHPSVELAPGTGRNHQPGAIAAPASRVGEIDGSHTVLSGGYPDGRVDGVIVVVHDRAHPVPGEKVLRGEVGKQGALDVLDPVPPDFTIHFGVVHQFVDEGDVHG